MMLSSSFINTIIITNIIIIIYSNDNVNIIDSIITIILLSVL